MRDHVRFTTQPLELPSNAGALTSTLAAIDAERLLVYGSGPPVWHDDDPRAAVDALPAHWRPLVFRENASELYATASVAS